MPTSAPPHDAVRPTAAEANERIREHCAGRVVWSGAALAELARLREQWQAAVTEERAA